jgi:hypothetical protein
MLPRRVTVNTASALLGRSPKAVRKLLDDGVLASETVSTMYGWRRIKLSEIERFRGSPVSAVEYLETMADLERQRGYWRGYQAARRQPELPSA